MVETGVIQNPHGGVNSARFRIIRAENQPSNARVHQRTGAHRTRFNCSKQVRASQTMVAYGRSGFSEGDDFGMGGWIAVKNVAVEAASDNTSVVDDDCAHGDFSGLECPLGETQGLLHPQFVGAVVADLGHGGHCRG